MPVENSHETTGTLEKLSEDQIVIRIDCPICGRSVRVSSGERYKMEVLYKGDETVDHHGSINIDLAEMSIDSVEPIDPNLKPFEEFFDEKDSE